MFSRIRVPHFVAAGRLASVPTIWSNCLAGWWLGGAGGQGSLPFLFMGATLLHLGGSLLHEAFEAEHDRLQHLERPTGPSLTAKPTAWGWSLGLLAAGALVLLWTGQAAGGLGLVLVSLMVIRSAVHPLVPLSPVLDGLSRLMLYLLGATLAVRGVTGWSFWCGLAQAAYVAGVGCLRQPRADGMRTKYWPLLLLFLPVVLAVLMDAGPYRETGLLLSLVVSLWALRALRPVFWSPEPEVEVRGPAFRTKTLPAQGPAPTTGNVPARQPTAPAVLPAPERPGLERAQAGLMAGIVFVDWLAVCPVTLIGQNNQPARQLSLAFLALFAATLLLQRVTSIRAGQQV